MLKNKAGQVTVFIILGILIVTVLATIFVFRGEIFKSEFEREADKIKVASEFLPVKTYLNTCIEEVALDGAILIGQQAGYINVPEDSLPINPLVPFSNSLDVFGNNVLTIPYWFYETANGIQKQQIPSKEEMEEQLSNYIKDNANTCLGNFSSFEEYEIRGFTSIESEVQIRDNAIFVKVISPVNVKFKGLEQEIDTFIVGLNVPLGSLYEVANKIIEKEENEFFFEEKTIDMMVLYDEIPFSGSDLDCNVKIWEENQVKSDFKNIVSNNIGRTNLNKGTEKYFDMDLGRSDVNSNFRYSTEWPFIMEVTPNENGILKGEDIIAKTGATKFLTQFLCINNYHFVYDVKYPVLITLDKDNYIFQFALQVVIDNNQPRKNLLGRNLQEPTFDICSQKLTPIKVYTLNVNEDNALVDLENTKISFKCFSTTCSIGSTIRDEFNEVYLSTEFPQCLNGLIIAEKEGYFKGEQLLNTNQEQTVSLLLEKYNNLDLDFIIVNKNNGEIESLESDEKIVLQLDSKSGDNKVLVYPEQTKLDLIADNYEVKAYIVKKSDTGIKIGEEEIRKCVKVPKSGLLGFFLEEERCVDITLEESILNEVVTGGVQFDLEVNRNELFSANKITFYVIDEGIPRTHEDITEVYENLIGNTRTPYFQIPEFENE